MSLSVNGWTQYNTNDIAFVQGVFKDPKKRIGKLDTLNFDWLEFDRYTLRFSSEKRIKKFVKLLKRISEEKQLMPMNVRSISAKISIYYKNGEIDFIWVFGSYFVCVNNTIYSGGELLYEFFFKTESDYIRCKYANDYSMKVFKACNKKLFEHDEYGILQELYGLKHQIVFKGKLIDFVKGGSCGVNISGGIAMFEVLDESVIPNIGDTVFVNILCPNNDMFVINNEYVVEAFNEKPDYFPQITADQFEKFDFVTLYSDNYDIMEY